MNKLTLIEKVQNFLVWIILVYGMLDLIFVVWSLDIKNSMSFFMMISGLTIGYNIEKNTPVAAFKIVFNFTFWLVFYVFIYKLPTLFFFASIWFWILVGWVMNL